MSSALKKNLLTGRQRKDINAGVVRAKGGVVAKSNTRGARIQKLEKIEKSGGERPLPSSGI